jgi:hypothetical protein
MLFALIKARYNRYRRQDFMPLRIGDARTIHHMLQPRAAQAFQHNAVIGVAGLSPCMWDAFAFADIY